jgi:hypothetical protein
MTNENIINGFFDFRESTPKEMRGDRLMYDVKGCYKYLTESELFDYYIKTNKINYEQEKH